MLNSLWFTGWHCNGAFLQVNLSFWGLCYFAFSNVRHVVDHLDIVDVEGVLLVLTGQHHKHWL